MRENEVKKEILKEEKKRKKGKMKKEASGMPTNILSAFFLLSDDKVSVIFWFL